MKNNFARINVTILSDMVKCLEVHELGLLIS